MDSIPISLERSPVNSRNQMTPPNQAVLLIQTTINQSASSSYVRHANMAPRGRTVTLDIPNSASNSSSMGIKEADAKMGRNVIMYTQDYVIVTGQDIAPEENAASTISKGQNSTTKKTLSKKRGQQISHPKAAETRELHLFPVSGRIKVSSHHSQYREEAQDKILIISHYLGLMPPRLIKAIF